MADAPATAGDDHDPACEVEGVGHGPKLALPLAMPVSHQVDAAGVAEVVIDFPPVNALPVDGWFELAGVVRGLGADPNVRVVIVAAEGRGFCAGVDIKELQNAGHEALVGVNRGCYAAFAAVYECEVPVIAAVHGFCLGGGVGIVGNADIVIASADATFGLPEVDRGALGAATHLARLVPQHKMRAMVYTATKATAEELHHYMQFHDAVEDINTDLGRILAVTADDVKRVANTYLDPGNLLTVIVRAGTAAPAPGG